MRLICSCRGWRSINFQFTGENFHGRFELRIFLGGEIFGSTLDLDIRRNPLFADIPSIRREPFRYREPQIGPISQRNELLYGAFAKALFTDDHRAAMILE